MGKVLLVLALAACSAPRQAKRWPDHRHHHDEQLDSLDVKVRQLETRVHQLEDELGKLQVAPAPLAAPPAPPAPGA